MALCAVTCLFNPAGGTSRYLNYQWFKERLNLPLYTIELAIGDQPFVLPPDEHVFQVRSSSHLWHKERLLNLCIARLPADYDLVAWLDADIAFDSMDWSEVERLLRRNSVIQLFNEVYHLATDGTTAKVDPGLFSKQLSIHPGFAWAAHREILAKHGLWDAGIAGGGDALMVCAMMGWSRHRYMRHFNLAVLGHFFEWGMPLWRDVKGRIGVLPGTIRHAWHGDFPSRRYIDRFRIIKDFDPKADLITNNDGCWEWNNRDDLDTRLKGYFLQRHH